MHAKTFLLLLFTLPATSVLAQPEEEPRAVLSRTRVPAVSRQESILRIAEFGRYAILVKSAQGTALQLIDHMSGPGRIHGRIGEENGRIDAFLDRGEYKVVLWSHELGSGEAALEVHPFAERNTEPLRIVELKPVALPLGDFEQASYWLEVDERRHVILEAAGRNLSDLRLWRDGSWLVDASPTYEPIAPKVGQPLRLYQLVTRLEPGLYRLTAYGGHPEPWAQENGENPFHLRFGIPRLGSAGRSRYEVGAFGLERFLVSGPANFFRIELPEAKPATLRVAEFREDQPFLESGKAGHVVKESLPPVAELEVGGNSLRIVTVSGEAGQPFVLQHFDRRHVYTFNQRSGNYWLSTIHSGHPTDSIDATGLLVRSRARAPANHQTVELSREKGWSRRANLLQKLTLFLRVTEEGRYEILSRGTEARFRIAPFLISKPKGYRPPAFKGSESVWDLEKGFYVLTVEPVKKGILDVAIKPVGFLDTVLDWVGLGLGDQKSDVRASVRFQRVSLSKDSGYTLYLNEQPGVKAGAILRHLPLDLRDPLPMTLRPERLVVVPFRASERGVLTARAEDGSRLDVSIDGRTWRREIDVRQGTYEARVRHTRADTLNLSLHLEPFRTLATTPLPRFDAQKKNRLTNVLTVLTDTEPHFFDLDWNEAATYLVRVHEPALYRLQTTGLLATEGNLRTRINTSYRRQKSNGVGRNFLVQQYLREGDYQITVSPQGHSKGHLGLELERTALRVGGTILEGVPARITLAAGEAVAYELDIRQAGSYRLETFGLGRTFRARLEDSEGWPIEPPNQPAQYHRHFEPGKYRLILLPEAVETRRLTRLAKVNEPERLEGHGPHELHLDTTATHTWTEPAEGQERLSDVWEFTLPATVDVSIRLTNEMQGTLRRLAADGTYDEVGFVPPERGLARELPLGRYRLEVVCSRENNAVSYALSVTPRELVAGLERKMVAPSAVAVAVGPGGLSELSSFWSSDVRATLRDASGNVVAWSDDRPDDWNFQILRRLPEGRYELAIDPVGTARAQTVVSFHTPSEVEREPLVLPASREMRLGESIELYPLVLPATGSTELLLVMGSSPESIGAAVERRNGDGWTAIASSVGSRLRLAVPISLTSKDELRLRLWSRDQRRSATRIEVRTFTPTRFTEAQAAEGVRLEAIAPDLAIAAVNLDRPGVFRVGESALWSSRIHQAMEETVNGLALPTEDVLWLMADQKTRLHARRLSLQETTTTLTLGPGIPVSVDVGADASGPVLVIATSFVGQPAVQVSDAMAVVPGAAASAALDGRSARVWMNGQAGERPLEARVRRFRFPAPESSRPGFGSYRGALEGVAVRAFDLPPGSKQIRLTLGEDSAAVLADPDGVLSVHWSGGEPFQESVVTAASRLLVLHYGEREARFVADVLPASDVALALSAGTPFRQPFTHSGTFRLPVSEGTARRRIRVSGAATGATFVSTEGTTARGRDLVISSEPGYLLLRHGPGTAVSWVESDETRSAGRAPATTVPVLVEPPVRLSLSGVSRRLQIELEEPAVLHLRTTGPVATRFQNDLAFHPEGAVLDRFVPAGTAEVELHAIGAGTLYGEVEVATSPVVSIGEGLGPEVLLPAGTTRVFSFEVAREGLVGVGVRASSDLVSCVLMNLRGESLGEGVVQMHTLSPGHYLLAIEVPNHAPAVTARPAVAGIEPPSTGPPSAVVRRYIESGN